MNWHPFTEEPKDECQYLVQHFYKSWSGEIIITYEVVPSLEELVVMVKYNKKIGNRDNHYQAWMPLPEPYKEVEE